MQAIESIIDILIVALSSAVVGLLMLVGSLFPTLSYEPLVPTMATTTPTLPVATSSDPIASSTLPAAPDTKPTAPKPVAATPIATPAPASTPAVPTAPAKAQETVNVETRAALVNILCTVQSSGALRGISGSGIIVDSRGIILTNAHIGQYFLLRDYIVPGNVNCTIRTGSPAEPRYTATLLYLPPAWITANASQLVAQQAVGTGEHDYAFLLITGRTDPQASLPASFARVEMDSAYPTIGQSMLLAAYPAGFLSGQLIEKSLYASSAIAGVTQLFTFDDDTTKVDLFSIGGSVVSQAGSSGGAVVRDNGSLAGIITTATVADTTAQRDLRAVTLSHINKSLAASGQGGIMSLLSGNAAAKASIFAATTAPSEKAALEAVLGGR